MLCGSRNPDPSQHVCNGLEHSAPGQTFFVNVHCDILFWIEWLLGCFVLDKLNLFLSVLG